LPLDAKTQSRSITLCCPLGPYIQAVRSDTKTCLYKVKLNKSCFLVWVHEPYVLSNTTAKCWK
jgi:hypothetical protein